ncbi:MAG: peptide/nickel transport system ATP-binding protein [Candidatus Magnetoglobus multicellularis str. Araruama]|uniref:Peptide/nickel transport system ATP-binding protein n=1 Tax=Candidatus Magnetoglobus multicellularis str. Araruama TaxID=890399 RepID=A0A1V1P5H1_9BACT|nr:MAG: peptide/nickel transport system ATP-binding protein [Candidatus Magnetoglobus multicellularis str. Araruama]
MGHVKAVDDVSFSIQRGETIGLVGESGCGKTSLGRTIMLLEKPYDGDVRFEGQSILSFQKKDKKQLRRKMQMIFQDPQSSLNPRMNVLDIVTEGLKNHGLLKSSQQDAAINLLHEVGLESQAMFRYPHEFSGGQRQRISIARAISMHPELVICDEAVSALDVSIQAQIINLLMDLQQKHDFSYIFISHDLSVVNHISDRVAVMYLGKIVELGPTQNVMKSPCHPYTQALISAIPVPGKKRPSYVFQGTPPSPINPPSGCRFHPRCPYKMDICQNSDPLLNESNEHHVACHLKNHSFNKSRKE